MSEYVSHYLPVAHLAMNWGFYLTGIGRGRFAPGTPYPAAFHPSLYQFNWNAGRTLPEFQLILITEGDGIFESEPTGRVRIRADSYVFLFPGVWHRYRPDPKTGWTERWLSFHGDIAHRLADLEILLPSKAISSVSDPDRYTQQFDVLLDSLDAKRRPNPIELSFQVMALLAVASESLDGQLFSVDNEDSQQFDRVGDPLVAQALEFIWTSSHRILSVDQLARRLPVTRRTLDRRFRVALGRSVLDEINRCRISRAKRFLEETLLPLKTIAHLVGFTDAERMRVVFLSTEQMTPSAFRERSRRNPRR